MRLALDHLTVVDSDPLQLVEAASESGFGGVCLFMESMNVLPAMPVFSLLHDAALRRELRNSLDGSGVLFDLAYPFTLSGRTHVPSLESALECAAQLGAKAVNALVYDRDVPRRAETFFAFCDLANSFGLIVALEFYPASQVRSLADALDLVRQVDRIGQVGINVDLLHLMRSHGSVAELDHASEFITYGQICDGPATRPENELEFEASSDRLLPGSGTFDVAGFVARMPRACPISVEVPGRLDLTVNVSRSERARRALEAAHGALSKRVHRSAGRP